MKPATVKTALALIGFCLAISGNPSRADSITLTGADLLASPYVTFPTTQPVLSGDSIRFGPGSNAEKLFVLSLAPLLPSLTSTLSLNINLTRLPCSGSCAWGEINDWDPGLFLSDGTNLFGFRLVDNISGWTAVSYTDLGNRLSSDLGFTNFPGTAFPSIGDSVDVNSTFTLLSDQTVLDVAFLSQSESATTTRTFDATTGLSLVLARDNDAGEQYQINSISLSVAAIPEPETYAMMLAGLLFVGIAKRHHSNNHNN